MPKVTLEGWKCFRCEHTWLPREDEHPKVCPKCKSPYWDTPRRDAVDIARKYAKRKKSE